LRIAGPFAEIGNRLVIRNQPAGEPHHLNVAASLTLKPAANVDRQLDEVQAAVVTAHQASLIAAKLIPKAKQEVASAEEALRLTQKNLQAGTGLTIDVLQFQDAADQARLRYATAL
jgi:outer membrane protein TolC